MRLMNPKIQTNTRTLKPRNDQPDAGLANNPHQSLHSMVSLWCAFLIHTIILECSWWLRRPGEWLGVWIDWNATTPGTSTSSGLRITGISHPRSHSQTWRSDTAFDSTLRYFALSPFTVHSVPSPLPLYAIPMATSIYHNAAGWDMPESLMVSKNYSPWEYDVDWPAIEDYYFNEFCYYHLVKNGRHGQILWDTIYRRNSNLETTLETAYHKNKIHGLAMALRYSISQTRRDGAKHSAKKDEREKELPPIWYSGATRRECSKILVARRIEAKESKRVRACSKTMPTFA